MIIEQPLMTKWEVRMDQKPLGKQQQRKAQNQQRICSLQKILEEFFPTQNDIPCREYLTPQKNNLGSP